MQHDNHDKLQLYVLMPKFDSGYTEKGSTLLKPNSRPLVSIVLIYY